MFDLRPYTLANGKAILCALEGGIQSEESTESISDSLLFVSRPLTSSNLEGLHANVNSDGGLGFLLDAIEKVHKAEMTTELVKDTSHYCSHLLLLSLLLHFELGLLLDLFGTEKDLGGSHTNIITEAKPVFLLVVIYSSINLMVDVSSVDD